MVTDEPQIDLLKHYSHFMMQYFIDIALWCHNNRNHHVVVLDCGPCTPWFDILASVATITILSPSQLNELADRFAHNVRVIDSGLGLAGASAGRRLRRFRRIMTKQVSDNARHTTDVFALRTTDQTRYQPDSWMRHIKNESSVARFLSQYLSVKPVEFFDASPREAITIMSSCRLFVGQRGAALMNLLFMPPGSTVVEIYPRDFQTSGARVEMYRRACQALGLRFVRVYQRSKFSKVSPLRLAVVVLWIRLSRKRPSHPAGARE